MLKSNLILKTYTGEVINPEGVANVDVCYKDQYVKNLNLTVVPGNGPSLLGRDWLNSIRLYWHEVNKISTRSPNIEAILKPFEEVFNEELSKLKGSKVKIQVDIKDAEPRFYKACTVPFAMKDKVIEQLTKLEEQGVIKPVAHFDWTGPIVPVLKSSGEVRILKSDFKVTVHKTSKIDSFPLPSTLMNCLLN